MNVLVSSLVIVTKLKRLVTETRSVLGVWYRVFGI